MNIRKVILEEIQTAAEEVKRGENVHLVACKVAIKIINACSYTGEERRTLYFKLLDDAEETLYEIAELEALRKKTLASYNA